MRKLLSKNVRLSFSLHALLLTRLSRIQTEASSSWRAFGAWHGVLLSSLATSLTISHPGRDGRSRQHCAPISTCAQVVRHRRCCHGESSFLFPELQLLMSTKPALRLHQGSLPPPRVDESFANEILLHSGGCVSWSSTRVADLSPDCFFAQPGMSRRSSKREKRGWLPRTASSGRWCVFPTPFASLGLIWAFSGDRQDVHSRNGSLRSTRHVRQVPPSQGTSLTIPSRTSYVHVAKHRTFDQVCSARLYRRTRTNCHFSTVSKGPRGFRDLPDGVEPLPLCAACRQDRHGMLSTHSSRLRALTDHAGV